MTKISIRKITVSDIPEVITIENESFSTPWSEVSFFSEINNPASICRAALSGDSLIGYVCASCILYEGRILNLAVRPDYRRKGVGKMLAQSILKELRTCGCKKIFLEVRASNTVAIRLYESIGFRMLSLSRGYYFLPREDAVIMGLQLP
jgi:ribosomal-protein-alanine N-acetyltransferase